MLIWRAFCEQRRDRVEDLDLGFQSSLADQLSNGALLCSPTRFPRSHPAAREDGKERPERKSPPEKHTNTMTWASTKTNSSVRGPAFRNMLNLRPRDRQQRRRARSRSTSTVCVGQVFSAGRGDWLPRSWELHVMLRSSLLIRHCFAIRNSDTTRESWWDKLSKLTRTRSGSEAKQVVVGLPVNTSLSSFDEGSLFGRREFPRAPQRSTRHKQRGG